MKLSNIRFKIKNFDPVQMFSNFSKPSLDCNFIERNFVSLIMTTVIICNIVLFAYNYSHLLSLFTDVSVHEIILIIPLLLLKFMLFEFVFLVLSFILICIISVLNYKPR